MGTVTSFPLVTALLQDAILDVALRIKLTADRTYYVDASRPDDSGDGLSSGAAFKTLQAAADAAMAIDHNGKTVTVLMEAGTYADGVTLSKPWVNPAATGVIFKQSGVSPTATDVLISVTSANCINLTGGAKVTIKDCELRAATSGSGIYAWGAGTEVYYGNVKFGACANYSINVFDGAKAEAVAVNSVAGARVAHWHAHKQSILNDNYDLDLVGSPSCSAYWIGVNNADVQRIGASFTGSGTGKRFLFHNVCNIDLGNVGEDPDTYFPGDTNGTYEYLPIVDYRVRGPFLTDGGGAFSGAPMTSPFQWLVEADNGIRSAYLSSQVRIEATNKAQNAYRVLALYGSSVYLGASGTASVQITSSGISLISKVAINGAPLTSDAQTGLLTGTAASGTGWRWTASGGAPSLQSVTYTSSAVAGFAALGIQSSTLGLSGNGLGTDQISLTSGAVAVASGNTVSIADTTDATSSTSAPLKSAGGIAAAKKIYSGTGFYGDGANITGLDAGNVSAGTLAVARGGTGATTARAAAGALKVPYVLASSGVQVTHTGDTAEFVLATISIPANSMGANGRLRILTHWTYTNSANSKSLRVRWGGSSGTVCSSQSVTTTAAFGSECFVQNRNATNSQVCGMTVSSGLGTGTINTASQDTTGAIDLVITGQLTNSAESVNLEGYCVELIVP
jgi:hypothetical protein